MGTDVCWRIPEWFSDIDPTAESALKTYHSELVRFNKSLNLISPNTISNADEIHFADAILGWRCILKCIEATQTTPLIDLGSGNGIPGLVCAILSPTSNFVLMDSDSRKCEFLRHCIFLLKLKNVTVQNSRVEAQNEALHHAMCRGYASIADTLRSVSHRAISNSSVFHFKGDKALTEISNSENVDLEWRSEILCSYELPASKVTRVIVLSKKT